MITEKKRYKKTSTKDKPLMGLLMFLDVLIIGFLVFGNLKLYAENKAINNQYLNISQEIKEIEGKNEELKELFSFSSEEEYTERMLREKGMYKKEGESVVVVTRDNTLKDSFDLQNGIETKSASVWSKIANFFNQIFGRD
jgi:cell division protein FtsL